MPLRTTMEARRSIRAFTEEPVTKEQIMSVLECGVLAPSGSNIQPWIFGIIDSVQIVEKIKAFSPGLGGNPPCLIVVCSDRELAFEKGGELGKNYLSIMDISMAAENMMLGACEIGLGTCAVKSFQPQALKTILGLPEHISPDLILTLGHPAKYPQKPNRRKLTEITFLNRWGMHYEK